jgi:prephenate dehydrogenase
MFESKNIGIIGIKGRFGRWLERFFSERGCAVAGADLGSALSIDDVVKRSDVVVFCVPLLSAVEAIEQAVPASRSSQLFLDITSIKAPAVAAMLESKAEVAGMHPLFAPPDAGTWKGGTVVVHRARVSAWSAWLDGLLEALQADVKTLAPAEHDALMLAEQNLPHLQSFAAAEVIKEMRIDPAELLEFGTKLSKKQFGILARMLSQKNAALYADIQVGNPGALAMIDSLISILHEYRAMIAGKDASALALRLKGLEEYFGDDFISKAFGFFDS